MKSKFSIITGLFLSAACTSIQPLETSQVTSEVSQIPQLRAESEASVGNALLSQVPVWRKSGYRVRDASVTRIGGGSVSVSTGDFLYRAQVKSTLVYCTEKPSFGMLIGGRQACFADTDGNGLLDQVMVASDTLWFKKPLLPQTAFEKSEIITRQTDAIKSELVYQGYSGGTLRLVYREYINDMARPSFFQEASYDVPSFPTEISFKAAQIQVISAGNNGIRYKVLAGF